MPSASEIITTDPTHPLFCQTMREELALLRATIAEAVHDQVRASVRVENDKRDIANTKDNYAMVVASARGPDNKPLYSNEFARDAAMKSYLLEDMEYIGYIEALSRHTEDLRICEQHVASAVQAREDARLVLAHATAYVQYLARG